MCSSKSRRSSFLVLLALVLLPLLVRAEPIFLSGFEAVDAGTANGDDYMWVTTMGSALADNKIGQTGQADCTGSGTPHACCSATNGKGRCQHDHKSGGHISSHRALQVNVTNAANQVAFKSLPLATKCTGDGTCDVIPGGTYVSTTCDYCTATNVGNAIDTVMGFQTYQTASVAFNVRFDTLPTINNLRTIFEFMEGDPQAVPDFQGCTLKIQGNAVSNRFFKLYYNATLIGTSGEIAYDNACSGGTAPDPTIGCTADSECPGTGAGRCGTCAAANPQHCYWTPVMVSQQLGIGGVTCTLSIRGRESVRGFVANATAKPVADVRLGAPENDTQNLTATFDDFVFDTSADAGWGYVAMGVPGFHGKCSVTTSQECALTSDCPSGESCNNPDTDAPDGSGPATAWPKSANTQTFSSCVSDFGNPEKPYQMDATGAYLQAKLPNLTAEFWRMQPNIGRCAAGADCDHQDPTMGTTCTNNFCVSLPEVDPLEVPEENGVITGVIAYAFGDTDNTAATRALGMAALTCTHTTDVSCATGATSAFSINAQNLGHMFGSVVAPTAPGGRSWDVGALANLGTRIQTTSLYDGSGSREINLRALLNYVRVGFQSVPDRSLSDRNRGVKYCTTHTDCSPVSQACTSPTDYTSTYGALRQCGWCENNRCIRDGILTIVSPGDSTNGATFSGQCVGGSLPGADCSQKDYCSWDVGVQKFKDHPPGGCNRNDTNCKICSGTLRIEENSGFGWPCSADNDCPNASSCHVVTGVDYCYKNDGINDSVVPCCTGGCCSTGATGECPDASLTYPSGTCIGGTYHNTPCDDSCDNLGGSCLTTATCELSCPGGTCTCAVNADCNDSAGAASGTCTSGYCGATRVCSENADCAPGQTCTTDTTTTYPGPGTCPVEKASWGAYLGDEMAVDQVLTCGVGGERTPELVQERLDTLLTGGEGCAAVVGAGRCTCAADADCGSGGTCCLTLTGCSGVDYGTCSAGAGARASCKDPTDCASGKTCRFNPPDLVVTLEGYNDIATGVNPNCRGVTIMTAPIPCDPARNALLPKYPCLSDSDATTATGSGDSQCFGVRPDANGLVAGQPEICTAPTQFGGCTVAMLNNTGVTVGSTFSACCTSGCFGGACTGTCSCPAAGCTNYIPGGPTLFGSPIGTANGVCHQSASCPSGYTKVGAGGAICHLNCTSDTDCTSGGAIAGLCTKWCNGGANDDRACTSDGQCTGGACTSNGANEKVCQGRATIPSDAITCTRDSDCYIGTFEAGNGNVGTPMTGEPALLRRFEGTCVSGRCTCTGVPNASSNSAFTPASDYCLTQTQRWLAESNDLAITQFHLMEREVAQLGQSVSPALMFLTIPGSSSKQVLSSPFHPETGYYGNMSRRILQEFPLYANPRTALSKTNRFLTHAQKGTDDVHLNVLGARLIGHVARDTIRTFNACRKSVGISQLYCVGPTGAFTTSGSPCTSSGGFCICEGRCSTTTTTTCDEVSDCPSGEDCLADPSDCPANNSCELKVCTSESDCPATTDSCYTEP